MAMHFTLALDRSMRDRVSGFWLYRSEETTDGSPTINGVYVDRAALGDTPPALLAMTLVPPEEPSPASGDS